MVMGFLPPGDPLVPDGVSLERQDELRSDTRNT